MSRFAILILCLFGLISEVSARDDRFSVNVSVDVTDKNAALARERAMAEANRAAFSQVAKKITTDESADRLAALPAAQLVNFIREIAVVSEKSSAVRYIATLRVSVNEELLKTYMQEQNMPFLMQTSSRVLIIPVYRAQAGAAPKLWEGENIWYQAWQGMKSENNVSFQPIPKTAANMSVMEADKALALDEEALEKIYRLNGVDDVYVAEASAVPGGLQLRLHSYKNSTNAFESLAVTGEGEDENALFAKAVKAAAGKISGQNRRQTFIQETEQHEIIVLYDYESLNDMVNTEKRLKDIAYVKNLQTDAVTGSRAQYRLTYVGTPEKLLSAMQEKHFILQDYDNFFVLHKI